MSVTIDLDHVKEELQAIDIAAKIQRKSIDRWYETNGVLKECPYEYKQSGTTREGTILEATSKVLSKTFKELEEGNFEAKVVPATTK